MQFYLDAYQALAQALHFFHVGFELGKSALRFLFVLTGAGLHFLGQALLLVVHNLAQLFARPLLALALPDEDAVHGCLAKEPCAAEEVWQEIRIERWRIGAQPYHALPGAA